METLINEMIPYIKDAWVTTGWLGGLGAFLMFFVRLIRTDWGQRLLIMISPKLAWVTWPGWVKWAVPFIFAAIGAVILKVAGGMAWAPAVAAAIAAAIVSIGGNHGTKVAGGLLDKVIIHKYPDYKPSLFRELSLPSKIGKDLQAPVLVSTPPDLSPPK